MTAVLNADQIAVQATIARHIFVGISTVGILVVVLGGAAAFTRVAGAVVSPGVLVVESSVKKVQHPTGGVIGEIRVKDGDHVKAGDILLRLDDVQTRANLAVITKSLDEMEVRRARLEAERDGAAGLTIPQDILDRSMDPEISRLIAGEKKLFEIRRAGRAGQIAQLRERILQLKEQNSGAGDQIASKDRQLELIVSELKGVNALWEQHLVQLNRVTTLQRDSAQVLGDRGALVSTIAQTKGKITETELQILQVDQDMRTEVGKELAEIRGKTSEMMEKKSAAVDVLKRIDIRAPQDGVVYQSAFHTVGGVINPAETIMMIVPEADELTVEARIEPQKIDQVHLDQQATLHFSAFNQRTTPEINGVVVEVSPDLTQDTKTGASFYRIRVGMTAQEIARLGTRRLLPGMPVEVFVQTESRSMLSYLVKPLRDQIMKAFRET